MYREREKKKKNFSHYFIYSKKNLADGNLIVVCLKINKP